MYHDELIEHYKYPKFKKKIANPDFSSGHHNPSCGDHISIEGIVHDGVVTDVGFSGSGCVISLASASLLTEHIVGKRIDEIEILAKEDIISMIGIDLGPTRLRCALLALEVLKQGISQYSSKTFSS